MVLFANSISLFVLYSHWHWQFHHFSCIFFSLIVRCCVLSAINKSIITYLIKKIQITNLRPATFLSHVHDDVRNDVRGWYFCIALWCKIGHFSLLHHFRHRTKHRSRHFNHANYTNPFPAYFHFRFLQINANTLHTHLIVVLHCYPSILANTCRNIYFHCIIWYLPFICTPIGSKPLLLERSASRKSIWV